MTQTQTPPPVAFSDDTPEEALSALGAEKRKHPRVAVRRAAVAVLANGRQLQVRTVDISLGGLGIVAGENLPVGTTLIVQLNTVSDADKPMTVPMPVEVTNGLYSGADRGWKIGLRYRDVPASMAAMVYKRYTRHLPF